MQQQRTDDDDGVEGGGPAAKKQKTEETKDAVDAPPPNTATYTKIRFIGYAIPTTPASMVPIGDPNGTGAVAGSYLGSECPQTDIRGRLAVLVEAVRTARARLPAQAEEEGVMNVFMAPEFYWHSPEGPYLHEGSSPVTEVLALLKDAFPKSEYPNWLFVCGTAITAKIENKEKLYGLNSTLTRNAVVESLCKQWRHSYGPLSEVILDMIFNFVKNCHAYPLLEVRNRAVIVSNLALDVPGGSTPTNAMTTEKYFCSNEDLLLYEVNGKKVVTEQMVTYRPLDLTAGDVKKTPLDNHAIFRFNHGNGTHVLDAAVEICLDHRDVRLRRNLDNHPFHLQLIPSCGIQIKENGCAVEAGGLVFNVDGQYALGQGGKGAQKGALNNVACLYADYVDAGDATYGAHTQLARVKTRAVGAHVNHKGSKNATFHDDLDPVILTVVPVVPVKGLHTYFAGGPGELHIYGLTDPLPLYV